MQYDIDYEKTCLDSARTRARQKNLTECTEKQMLTILLSMQIARRTASDFDLSLANPDALLTKSKANEMISDMAVDAIFRDRLPHHA